MFCGSLENLCKTVGVLMRFRPRLVYKCMKGLSGMCFFRFVSESMGHISSSFVIFSSPLLNFESPPFHLPSPSFFLPPHSLPPLPLPHSFLPFYSHFGRRRRRWKEAGNRKEKKRKKRNVEEGRGGRGKGEIGMKGMGYLPLKKQHEFSIDDLVFPTTFLRFSFFFTFSFSFLLFFLHILTHK